MRPGALRFFWPLAGRAASFRADSRDMLGVRRSDRLKVNAFPAVAHPPDESFVEHSFPIFRA